MSMWLYELLAPERLTHIVDVGANPIDGAPPYKSLLDRKMCRVTGFEPQSSALEALNARKSPLETYLPYAVGEGGQAQLNVCAYSGWSSLLRPSDAALEVFNGFRPNARVLETLPIMTRKLDDLPEIAPFDMLKIDVQGSELAVFRGGQRQLANAVLIQTEVSFIPLYEGQPAWGEVDVYLRQLGFVPHCFDAVKQLPIGPLSYEAGPTRPYRQLVEADVVYVKDFVQPATMTAEQLKQLGLLAFYLYGSIDLAGRCIQQLVQRGAVAADSLDVYVQQLNA